ncbi:hypothetical protein V6N12_006050 [Hibiscus sabdariffa]|uniref:BZIP domain-containing protein n=1 Tax=Hibiscus sabdariffa TaxID=183260 RepID=A0ABR2EWU6_9ROSI
MVPSELRGLHYLAPENPNLIPANLGMMQNSIPSFHFNTFLNSPPNSHITPSALDFAALSSSISNNSTSDEAEEHQVNVIDERKQRRMISNRESARRSRMRKQKHLDELWSQVIRLRNENHNLIDQLNHVSESHDRVLQENARLKEEASDLRQMLSDVKIGSPYSLAFREMEEVVSAGMNPVQIARGIEKTANAIVSELKLMSREVEDHELAHVATVSAGNDYAVGKLISDALQQVGRKGVVESKKENEMFKILDSAVKEKYPIMIVAVEKKKLSYIISSLIRYVGAQTQVESKDKQLRIEDALNATKVLSNGDTRYQYNAARNSYKDLMEAGIMDPTRSNYPKSGDPGFH